HADPADRGHNDPHARLRGRRPQTDGGGGHSGDQGGRDDARRGHGGRGSASSLWLAPRAGAPERAVRRASRDRAGRPAPLGAHAAPRARVRRARAARAPARSDAAAPAPGRDPADRQRRPRPRRAHAMILARLALGAAAGGAAYAWGAHLLPAGGAWAGPPTRRHIALTFDDGPDPAWTERTLAVLDREAVRASFFLVGERAARAPETVARIAAAGHEIASHGWSHRSLWLCGPRRTEDEVARAHRFLSDAVGRPVRHFRPPWGMVNAALFGALRRHGQRCVVWAIHPEGWLGGGSEAEPRRIANGCKTSIA